MSESWNQSLTKRAMQEFGEAINYEIRQAKANFHEGLLKIIPAQPYSLEELEEIFNFRIEWGLENYLSDNPYSVWQKNNNRFILIDKKTQVGKKQKQEKPKVVTKEPPKKPMTSEGKPAYSEEEIDKQESSLPGLTLKETGLLMALRKKYGFDKEFKYRELGLGISPDLIAEFLNTFIDNGYLRLTNPKRKFGQKAARFQLIDKN